MALSGAIMPGPLFTYTIARTIQTRRNGFLVGPRVIAGHAAIEAIILFGLAFGVAEFLKTPVVIQVIGVLGGLLLGYMGIGLIREAFRKKPSDNLYAEDGAKDAGPFTGRMSPVLAGALVSMSNPYWWVWWVTVGAATLMRFGVTIQAWQGLVAFFLGHEAADLAWYSAVSTLTHFGRKSLSTRVYNVILVVCGVFIIGFGAYLGASLFIRRA
jgi:threonine/homoserine/homoserine lactone efflux protein